ncbi:SAM hydrolase/SAM-dependent halogenase family protein [Oleidesulfovibrio sp.]|uniref:SAM hydrolase/SAM-dependent halogenase family protein n=1 Tax=Oleidesulfovibrio sp. TaxID=2909707 RepID=UPI003A8A38ED
MPASSPITLLTDFGTQDAYVAQMKAVIATLAPQAKAMDITHEITPQNIRQAGFFLASSAGYFPAGTIFVAVVDPGVGTERNILYAELNGYRFLAPDNGLLGALPLDKASIRRISPAATQTAFACVRAKNLCPAAKFFTSTATVPNPECGDEIPLTLSHRPSGTSSSRNSIDSAGPAYPTDHRKPDQAVDAPCLQHRLPFACPSDGLSTAGLTSQNQQALTTSATFHGRDIFAPLAAMIWAGASPDLLGAPATAASICQSDWSYATGDNSKICAQVLHIDRFGNIILNAPTAEWQATLSLCDGASLQCASSTCSVALVSTYEQIPAIPASCAARDITCNGAAVASDASTSQNQKKQSPASATQASSSHFGLLASSQGYLEIACNCSSAAAALSLSIGDTITITFHHN